MKKRKSSQIIFTHITLGLQLAITIFLFVYGGHYLDNKYQKSPLFLALGTVIGMVIGFYHMMKELQRDERETNNNNDDDDNDDDEKKKVRWM